MTYFPRIFYSDETKDFENMRSRMSTSIATEEKKEDGTENDEEKEERERRNELKREKMEKDQKEREVDMIPYQVRLRALGRAGASRSLRFKRLRKPRLLGQFVTQENKNVSKRSSPPPAPGSGKMLESVMSQNKDLKSDDEKISDETKRHAISSSSRKHPKHSSRSKLGEATRRRKVDIDRIERVWNDLEYPVQERMSFLCKYSQAEDAINLRPVVDASVRLCELILMRETVLSKMRSLQENPKRRMKWEHVFTKEESEYLTRVECSIDAVDYFGVPNFFRLAAVVKNLSKKCLDLLQYLRRDFGEVLTYRGADYLQCLHSSESIESGWQGSDWRKANMPPLVRYVTNPYLRRMNDHVL